MHVQHIRHKSKWQKRSFIWLKVKFWLGVLNDLKERGVEDILIACIDGLKSFPTAINSVFPNAESTAMYSASNKKFTKICIQQRCESFHE